MKQLLRKSARWVYRTLLPRRLKNTLQLFVLLDESDKPPVPIEDFAADNVVVLAPHMDDEIIGCGGTMRRHVLAGAAVTIVFLTDGRKGDQTLYESADLSPDQIAASESALVVRRKQESIRAAKIIGAAEPIFLDAPDSALEATPEIVKRLAAILNDKRPEIVYIPSMLDVHPDHWATHRVLLQSMALVSFVPPCPPTYREYEVWTPLLPNRVVDITDVFEVRQQALEQFESQNTQIDYVRAAGGLSVYRTIYQQQGRGHAEAFFESTPEMYRLLFERFTAKR